MNANTTHHIQVKLSSYEPCRYRTVPATSANHKSPNHREMPHQSHSKQAYVKLQEYPVPAPTPTLLSEHLSAEMSAYVGTYS